LTTQRLFVPLFGVHLSQNGRRDTGIGKSSSIFNEATAPGLIAQNANRGYFEGIQLCVIAKHIRQSQLRRAKRKRLLKKRHVAIAVRIKVLVCGRASWDCTLRSMEIG
jgi:hypothetical protein